MAACTCKFPGLELTVGERALDDPKCRKKAGFPGREPHMSSMAFCLRFSYNTKEEVNRMSDVLERVKRIVVDRLGADEAEVTLEASFKEDLGADSLDVVELVMELEDEFDLEISDEDAEKITTVGEVVNYIQSHT